MSRSNDDGASRTSGREAAWWAVVDKIRGGARVPYEEVRDRFEECSRARRPRDGPLPAWRPDPETLASSNLGAFSRDRGIGSLEELHRDSTRERARFWGSVIERLGVAFSRKPDAVLDSSRGARRPAWLRGARMNCVESCFLAPGHAPAIVAGSEGSAALRIVSYRELHGLVRRFADGLRAHGFAPGDGVALYMPLTVECVVAYLGVVHAGCRVISIADSFPAPELARRLRIGAARGVVTVASAKRGGKSFRPYETVREAGAERAIVIPAREGGSLRSGDLAWDDLLGSDPGGGARPASPDEVVNVLFSSGTTGDPKAIPWTHLTPLKCAMDGYFHQDIHPGDVVAWPTNIGWMMGPWLLFASLINRATVALFEGAPTGRDFLEFVRRARVNVLGVVPSLVRAWRASGERVAWNDVRVFSSTGEASNREDYLWLMSRAGFRAPVIEYCGGTEIGGGYLTGTVVQPASPATFTTPALGIDIVVMDERGRPVGEGEMGEVFLVPPSIGLSTTLLNADHDAIYYEGCPAGPGGEVLRRHGDQMTRLHRGYYRAQGRADDTMNLAGVKVGSVEIENAIESHAGVYECAAVAVQSGGEGADRLVLFVVPVGEADPDVLLAEVRALIARRLNPLFKVHDLVVVDRLPRTASNKLMRRELRARYLARR